MAQAGGSSLISKPSAIAGYMKSVTERKQSLVQRWLPSPWGSCSSSPALSLGDGSKDALSFGQRAAYLGQRGPDQTGVGSLSCFSAIPGNWAWSQLLPGQNTPAACFAVVLVCGGRGILSQLLEAQQHPAVSYGCLWEPTWEAACWEQDEWPLSGGERFLLHIFWKTNVPSPWFHTHTVHRLWKACQHLCFHTEGHKSLNGPSEGSLVMPREPLAIICQSQ